MKWNDIESAYSMFRHYWYEENGCGPDENHGQWDWPDLEQEERDYATFTQ